MALFQARLLGHSKIVLTLHTMMGSYKDDFTVKRMDDNMAPLSGLPA